MKKKNQMIRICLLYSGRHQVPVRRTVAVRFYFNCGSGRDRGHKGTNLEEALEVLK